MKKILATVFSAVALVAIASMAYAALSATLTMEEVGAGRLQANVVMGGIADCPTTGSVTVVFTSPNEKKWQSQSIEAPWRSCSKYLDEATNTSGAARTRARITVRRKSGDSLGTWKVTVKAGDTVLATGEYTVE